MTTVPSTPYDTADYVLELARSISADAATENGLAGDILASTQPYVFPMLTKIYRDLQDELISGSSEIMNKYGFLLELEPTAFDNPRINVTVSYLGYTYGFNQIDPDITLPPDMIKPLELWECISGQQAWVPMVQAADSLSSRPTTGRFRIWDFQGDQLILPGASQTNDLKIKYVASFPDLVDGDSQIYILRSQTFLACQLVSEVAAMLGGLEMAADFEKRAIKGKTAIINRTARKEAYASYQRRPFRGRGSGRGRRR
jgi:hypothetical protein